MKRTFTIDGSPATHVLDSFMHTKVSYPEALGELVDNSLDQAAQNVRIVFNGDSVSVIDDGNGCADLQAMLRLGSHKNTRTTRLGRYGVGLKNVALGLGERLDIRTRQDGIERRASVHWPTLRDSGNWHSITGEEEETDFPNGTEISISRLHSSTLKLKTVVEALRFSFAPALWAGRSIIVAPKNSDEIVIKAWEVPNMANEVTDEDTYDSGIGFKVRAGVVDNNPHEPFVLAYEHRIIAGTSEPCFNLSASNRFLGFVELRGKWPLLKHKDGLRDSKEAEWLYESLHAICKPLLVALHREGDAVELSEIASELELHLGGLFGRPRRRKKEESETIEPRNTIRPVREAEQVTPSEGDALERSSAKAKHGFNIRYQCLAGAVIGKVDVNRKRVEIVLNENHRLITHYRELRDKLALKHVAVVLLCQQQSIASDPSQMLLKFESQNSSERFTQMYSALMQTLAEADIMKEAA